mmetsp:Transcript_7876/g.13043  ORF Transcript_7876/g.13043 Transcript_7876/m.13043 type:complete len:338 (-) Transcript_7876:138-1151(-)
MDFINSREAGDSGVDREANSRNSMNVWCHVCSANSVAVLNEVSNEYECLDCSSDCVEAQDQGAEDFYSAGDSNRDERVNSAPPPTSTGNEESIHADSVIEAQQFLQQVVDGILSSSSTDHLPLSSFMADGGSARPIVGRQVGVVIRHPSGQTTTRLFNNHISNEVPTDHELAAMPLSIQNRGIINLLGTIGSTQINSNVLRFLSQDSDNVGPVRTTISGDEMGSLQLEQFLHHVLMNETSTLGAPPMPKDALDRLPRRTVTTADMEDAAAAVTAQHPEGVQQQQQGLGECCITRDPFEVGDVVVSLDCGHSYKEESIVHWLEMHNTCPVCRVTVKVD